MKEKETINQMNICWMLNAFTYTTEHIWLECDFKLAWDITYYYVYMSALRSELKYQPYRGNWTVVIES